MPFADTLPNSTISHYTECTYLVLEKSGPWPTTKQRKVARRIVGSKYVCLHVISAARRLRRPSPQQSARPSLSLIERLEPLPSIRAPNAKANLNRFAFF